MATLSDVSQAIIDKLLYYTDWGGSGAPSAVTIAQKEEGPLLYWLNDVAEASAYPFLTLYATNWPMFSRVTIKQVDVKFIGQIHIVDKAVAGENPYQNVRQLACKIVDNILYAERMTLAYIETVDIQGIQIPPADMVNFLNTSGRGLAAAFIPFTVTCKYLPYP